MNPWGDIMVDGSKKDIPKFELIKQILQENNGIMELYTLCREAHKRLPKRKNWEGEIIYRNNRGELILVEHDNHIFVALPGYEENVDQATIDETEIEPPKEIPKEKYVKSVPVLKKEIKILPVRAEDYLPKSCPEYVPQDKELELIDAHMESGINLLFVGPKGTGKTLAFAYYAYKNKIPIIQFDCSEQTKRQDLIGRFLLIGNEVVYQLGVLPTAIEVANQYGKAILVMEEINCLTSFSQKIMNQILDWRRHVYIPEIGKTYRLKNGAKLLIAGTMNPSTYSGVFELNEDLRSRFAEYHINYPNEEKENEIISKLTNLDDEIRRLIIRLAEDTRQLYVSGEINYALSTRDLITFANLFEVYTKTFDDKKTALIYALRTTVLYRYDNEQERETIRKRIYSVFGVEV